MRGRERGADGAPRARRAEHPRAPAPRPPRPRSRAGAAAMEAGAGREGAGGGSGAGEGAGGGGEGGRYLCRFLPAASRDGGLIWDLPPSATEPERSPGTLHTPVRGPGRPQGGRPTPPCGLYRLLQE